MVFGKNISFNYANHIKLNETLSGKLLVYNLEKIILVYHSIFCLWCPTKSEFQRGFQKCKIPLFRVSTTLWHWQFIFHRSFKFRLVKRCRLAVNSGYEPNTTWYAGTLHFDGCYRHLVRVRRNCQNKIWNSSRFKWNCTLHTALEQEAPHLPGRTQQSLGT